MAAPRSVTTGTPAGGKAFEQLGASPLLTLATTGQDVMRRLREAFGQHGLKPRQFRALDLLEDRGPIGQRELGEALAIDHSILVTLLNPLEADGLLTRDRDPGDRRRHVVSITPAGAERLKAGMAAQRAVEEELLAGFSAAQRAELADALATIRRRAGAGEASPADDAC
jgi:DNA-binding MarR family transcriptional regulator